MRNFLSFDIELYDNLPEENPDFNEIRPSVAAYCLDDLQVKYFDNAPEPMSKETAKNLVLEMLDNYKKGIIPLTHNGLSFDFKVLAYTSTLFDECAFLALNHIDTMFIVTCNKGYFISLNSLLIGAGVESKLHAVTLNDGSVLDGFSGKLAPEMWRKGEINAVRTYLATDVQSPMKLANKIEKEGKMFWFSKSGNPQVLYTNLIPVKECLKLKKPDVHWMSNPPTRESLYSWIPSEILKRNGVELT
jgi:hypothetical protein